MQSLWSWLNQHQFFGLQRVWAFGFFLVTGKPVQLTLGCTIRRHVQEACRISNKRGIWVRNRSRAFHLFIQSFRAGGQRPHKKYTRKRVERSTQPPPPPPAFFPTTRTLLFSHFPVVARHNNSPAEIKSGVIGENPRENPCTWGILHVDC